MLKPQATPNYSWKRILNQFGHFRVRMEQEVYTTESALGRITLLLRSREGLTILERLDIVLGHRDKTC